MKNLSQDSYVVQFKLVLTLVLFSIVTRLTLPPLLGHPVNFSPIDAVALFCGAYFSRFSLAIFATLCTVWVSDIIITKCMLGHWALSYPGFYWQYACYAFMTFIGTATLTLKVKPLRLLSACLASSVLFFIVTNFGVWYSKLLYPSTLNGLIACYVAAIPFFKNTLLSDLFFSLVLFKTYEWIVQFTKQASPIAKQHV